jgi:hypothetical protein
MLCSLLPLSLGRQNIPDGCNIPYYPLNIQFPARIPPQRTQQRAHPPACHFWHCCHLFTSAPYPLLNTPALLHTPALSSGTLGISTTYPLTQKTLFVILSSPGSPAYILVYTVFWVVGLVPYTLIMYVGLNPSTDI